MRSLTVALLAGLFCPIAATAQTSAAKDVASIIRDLRKLGVRDPGAPPPASVAPTLKRLNAALGKLLVEVMNDPRRSAGEDILDFVARELTLAGWEQLPPHKWEAYGEIVDIELGMPREANQPALRMVTTHLWLPCGGSDPDAMVYVFEQRGKRWELVLVTDADYDPVNRSVPSALAYEISPPGEKGEWFLAVAHSPPELGCAEPKSIVYKVLRPGATAESPFTILRNREAVDHRFDPPFKLEVAAGSVSITRGVTRHLDEEPAIQVSAWEISGNQAVRIGPLGPSPADFFDYWLQLEWNDAVHFAALENRVGLRNWHRKLKVLKKGLAVIDFSQKCLPRGDSWVVGVTFDRPNEEVLGLRHLHAAIAWSDGQFTITSLSEARPNGCPGNTPPTLRDFKLPM